MNPLSRLLVILIATFGLSSCQLIGAAAQIALRMWPLFVENEVTQPGGVEARAGQIQRSPVFQGHQPVFVPRTTDNVASH